MTNIWKCNDVTLVPGYGIIRPGQNLEFEDGQEPAEVKNNFYCMTSSQVKEEEERKVDENDLTFEVKVERLKAMKVKLPRGLKKTEVERLFDEYVNKVELPEIL